MNGIECTNRQFHNTGNPMETTNERRRLQQQPIHPNTDTSSQIASGNQATSCDIQNSASSTSKHNTIAALTLLTVSKPSSVVSTPGAGNSNSLPGHQSSRTKQNHHLLDQQALNLSDSLNASVNVSDRNANNSPPSALLRKKNLSTSDLDPFERRKQAALVKVEAKLEKAQHLYERAQQSVEQEISDFLRATTIPNTNNELNCSRTTNATFDKRIRALQDTKKEIERKIANYHSDISRIQAGEIPYNYTSSKDILSNIKHTAAKVASGSLKHRSTNNTDQISTTSNSSTNEQVNNFHHSELDSHYHNSNLTPTLITSSLQPSPSINISGQVNTNQNLLVQNQYTNTFEPTLSSVSSSISNEIGNSQFYIDANYDHIYDTDKATSRKHDTNIPADGSMLHDNDKSPTSKRRFTDDSIIENNDRTSDHSVDDRGTSTTSKRYTPTTTVEYQQLNAKLDSMQKLVDRYESKISDMQKQIDSLIIDNETQLEKNEHLNNDLTDLTDLHQLEMSSMKTELKNLEERLLYKFGDYWNELLDKLDKLDTRTAKVEQTQTHSLETEENTHRIISKLVNIVLTVFAIILLLLSTIKNLVQSRVHAMTVLILVLVWIGYHYFPPNYFQTSFLKNFPNTFKRAS